MSLPLIRLAIGRTNGTAHYGVLLDATQPLAVTMSDCDRRCWLVVLGAILPDQSMCGVLIRDSSLYTVQRRPAAPLPHMASHRSSVAPPRVLSLFYRLTRGVRS